MGNHNADLAHLVERRLPKAKVAGSSPVIRSIYGPVVQLVRTLACHARGQGFESPSGRQTVSQKRGKCLCSSVGRAGD